MIAEQIAEVARRVGRDRDEISVILKHLVPDAEQIAEAVRRLRRLADDPSISRSWRDEILIVSSI
jgi:hypothetical protein